MPSFLPFLPATGVVRNGLDVLVTLPDPDRGVDEPLIRPGVPRYAGATLDLLPLATQGGGPDFPLLAPVDVMCRRLPLVAALPGLPDVTLLLELSPLPFRSAAVLRRLPGIPTLYIGLLPASVPPGEDDLLRAGDAITTVGAAWVGLLFADRLTLSPAAWIEQIALAMTGVDSPEEIATWRTLARFDDPGARGVRVLDHVGRPAVGEPFRITGPAGTSTATTGPGGRLDLPPGAVELRWEQGVPVHARYEATRADPADRATSSRPGEPIPIPADAPTGHLQLFDTSRWFAARPPQLDPRLGRLHPDSRLEPLVDGVDSFRAMLADLRAATGPGDGAHFVGWAFNDFPLDLADPEQTMLVEVVKTLRGGSSEDAAGTRFLMDRYFVFRPDAPTEQAERLAILLVLEGVHGVIIVSLIKDLELDDAGFVVLNGLALAGIVGFSLIGVGPLLEKAENIIDQSEELAEQLNAIKANIALRARHPSRFVDNALTVANPLPLEPAQFVDGVGSYHQKFQVIRRTPDALGNRVVGHLGGIDLNRNRLDTPGHHGQAWRAPGEVTSGPSAAAFHDVHARVTGPAAADIALTFDHRWAFDVSRQPPEPTGSPPLLPLAFATPDAGETTEVPPQPARHVVQVARSGYAPDPTAGSPPLPWSPTGEATIPEAMIKAIEQAREYIYIEDQYFTPPDAYIHALLEASVRTPKLRLVIVLPTAPDQIFGDIRRRQIFDLLRKDPNSTRGWGDRMVVGAPVRRPVLADGGRVAGKGRLLLFEPLSAAGDVITVGQRARLPGSAPFWVWISGERMLAFEQREDVVVDEVPCRRYFVRRSSDAVPAWGALPRPHAVRSPVTLAQVHGIYVHTKALMVDDVFVGIGSCNVNRRGFYYDAEIAAFAVPEALKAAPENPARALRTALWAEHLGLPPAMGAALLADPVAAFELFRRATLNGNRISPFEALGSKPDLDIFPSESATLLKMFTTFGLNVAEGSVPYIWNVLVDPTTRAEPLSQVGPTIGPGV